MKKILIVFIILCTPSYWSAHASSSIDELMHSYMIARADSDRGHMSADEIKKFPYTVQVASYLNEGDAISHADELRSEKLSDVRYYPTFVRGEVWYKVAVGKFTKKAEAKKLQEKLSQKYNEPFAVVVSLLQRPSADESYDREPSATEIPAAAGDSIPSVEASANAPDAPKIKLIPLHKKLARRVHQALAMATPAAQKSAAVTPTATAIPTATASSAGAPTLKKDHYYALQVGAFPSKSLADAKITKMGLKGVDVEQRAAMVDGKKWHRVLVGRFATKKLALAYQATQSEALKGAFVRRIQIP